MQVLLTVTVTQNPTQVAGSLTQAKSHVSKAMCHSKCLIAIKKFDSREKLITTMKSCYKDG